MSFTSETVVCAECGQRKPSHAFPPVVSYPLPQPTICFYCLDNLEEPTKPLLDKTPSNGEHSKKQTTRKTKSGKPETYLCNYCEQRRPRADFEDGKNPPEKLLFKRCKSCQSATGHNNPSSISRDNTAARSDRLSEDSLGEYRPLRQSSASPTSLWSNDENAKEEDARSDDEADEYLAEMKKLYTKKNQ